MRTAEWLLLAVLSLLWGATFFFAAIAVKEIPPLTLVLARVALAALLLVPIVHWLGHRLPGTARGWLPFAVMGLLSNVIPFSLLFYGQTQIASGLAAVLNATTPLFSLLVAWLFAGEPLKGRKLAGVALGIAGVAVLLGPEALSARAASVVGMLCVLGTALSNALAGQWGTRLRGVPPAVSAGTQLVCSTVILLPFAGVVDRFWLWPAPSWQALAAVAGLAVLSTAVAYVIFFRILAAAGPVNVMLVTLLVPVTGIALGVLILEETLLARQIVGALVIGSALLVIDGRIFKLVRPTTPPR
jgi:drug/metabolite transporter (DMT)-like permease